MHRFSHFFIPLKTNQLRIFTEIGGNFNSSCDFPFSYKKSRHRADAVFHEKITVFFHVPNLIRVRIERVFEHFARTAKCTCGEYRFHSLIIKKSGAFGGSRSRNLLIKNQLFYQLNYERMKC